VNHAAVARYQAVLSVFLQDDITREAKSSRNACTAVVSDGYRYRIGTAYANIPLTEIGTSPNVKSFLHDTVLVHRREKAFWALALVLCAYRSACKQIHCVIVRHYDVFQTVHA
jgi:hypothetical protein